MERYEQLAAASGFPMSDRLKLEMLKSRVGPVSKLLLQRMEEENADRPFSVFYEALVRTYARDATEQARLTWNKIQLRLGPDRILSLDVFRRYAGGVHGSKEPGP